MRKTVKTLDLVTGIDVIEYNNVSHGKAAGEESEIFLAEHQLIISLFKKKKYTLDYSSNHRGRLRRLGMEGNRR